MNKPNNELPIPSHIPRGFMCCGCEHKHRKCNHLDFTKMRVIGVYKDDGVKEVKCTDYSPENELGEQT